MNWEPVNVWTSTLYALIHSLHQSKALHFGNPAFLEESARDAASWLPIACSYNSVLQGSPDGKKRLTFRRDPNKHFEDIARQIVKMLLQDLVVILDSMLTQVLVRKQMPATGYPQTKIRRLIPNLTSKVAWSGQGCLELVAVRNAMVHNGGYWNDQSIAIIAPFVVPPPNFGDSVHVGFSMLFNYRKAMRTFLNEVSR